MTDDVRRVNLRFAPDYFDKLDEKRFRSRLTFQELGAQLFDDWLVGKADAPMRSSIRRPADPMVEKLCILQARGEKGLLALAYKAIDACFAVLLHSVTPEELTHLKAVAYGEALPHPKPQEPPKRRGRPSKTA